MTATAPAAAVFGLLGETHTATEYLADMGALQPISSWTWAPLADLVQWRGTLWNGRQASRDVLWTLREHENGLLFGHAMRALGMYVDRSAAIAQRFDY